MTVKKVVTLGQEVRTVLNGVTSAPSYIGGSTDSCEGFGHDLSILGKADCGGPCLITHENDIYQTSKVVVNSNYKGSDAYTTAQGSNFGIGNNASDGTVKINGTTAIARTTPTSPVFSASVAIGEIRSDGIPSVIGVTQWRERAKFYRGSSGEYLNYQFGWLPFVNDIRNFCRAVKNQHELLTEFREGSGKNTRVSYHFPTSTQSDFHSTTVVCRTSSGISLGSGPGGVNATQESKAWFKGAFTYHLPVGTSALDRSKRFADYADHLLGVRLTPEVLWNLAPWSWAVDWFSNTGDIIHNFSVMGHDGLVLKYGYSMFLRQYSCYTQCSPSFTAGMVSRTVRSTYFRRLPANPYFGFGTVGTLSATQSAILVALGINHMR